MRIWLMRHGEAASAEGSGGDYGRRLSEEGRCQVARIGRWLKERAEHPDAIWHSPLNRACETAEILYREIGESAPLAVEPLLAPGMRCDRLLAKLSAQTEQIVVCVGHQPDIGRCLTEMLGGGRFTVTPGTVAAVNFHHVIAPGGGDLRWLLTPEWF